MKTESSNLPQQPLEHPPESGVKKTDYSGKSSAGKTALKELLTPVQSRIYIGQLFAALSGIAAIWPYIVLNRLGELLLPAIPGANIDNAAVTAQIQQLLTAFAVQISLYFISLLITHLADVKLRGYLQQRILTHLGTAPLSWFSQNASGRVRKVLQADTKTLHTLVAHKPVEITAAVVTPLTLMVYAFVINSWLGLLSIATVPLYLLAQMWMMRGVGEKTVEMDEHLSETSARGVEFVDGIEVVKSFGRTGKAHKAFSSAATNFADFYWDWCLPLIKGSALSIAIISAPVVMLISLGGGALLISAGAASLPQVLVCSLISLVIPLTLDVITNTTWSYQMAGAAALRLVELTQVNTLTAAHLSDTAGSDTTEHADNEPGTIIFDSVSYSYNAEASQKALDGVSLRLTPGTVTALVGPSGSGKSTLATMLTRFQDPDTGRVLIGGKDIRTMPEKELYQQVAFVLQRAQILRTSIRENIRLAVPDASDEKIIHAAQQAQIWDDIAALPLGLDSVIGQDTNLSGGQQQRIVIARALLNDAPILILDEATANTDPDCAAEIQKALNTLARGRTVLVIGHTAGVVAGADQICVMEHGTITACGTAEELAHNPYWRSLNDDAAGTLHQKG